MKAPSQSLEQIVMASILGLQDEQKSFQQEIKEKILLVLGQEISDGSIYNCLERLVNKGLISVKEVDITDRNTSRTKKLYKATPEGEEGFKDYINRMIKLMKFEETTKHDRDEDQGQRFGM